MTRPTSAAPAWLLEDLGKFYAPLLGTISSTLDALPNGCMAASRARRLAGVSTEGGVRAHVDAVLARRGTGLGVELLDGRRGWIEAAWEPTPAEILGRDHLTWGAVKSEPWGRNFYAGAAVAHGKPLIGIDPVRAAAVLDVALFGSDALVRVEIERVRIPAPTEGDVAAFLERKRAPGWRRPRATMPRDLGAPRPPAGGTAARVGIGSVVEIGGPGMRRGVVIEQARAGHWHLQDPETGALLGEYHARQLHNVGPIEAEILA